MLQRHDVMQRISSRHNSWVIEFRAAARGNRAALMLLDGAHLVAEAVAAGVRVRQAIVSTGAVERAHVRRVVDRMTQQGVVVAQASPSVMDAISPVRSPSEIVAIAERPVCDDGRLYVSAAPLVIVATDVQDPGNIGAIARVAEAGGATGLLATGTSADPFGWKALRGSMGSALRLPIGVQKSTLEALQGARRHGCRVVATVPRNGVPLFGLDLRGAVAMLVGGEGAGIAADLIEAADQRVTIPMRPPVESLNVAVATALLVYEARRQREPGGGTLNHEPNPEP